MKKFDKTLLASEVISDLKSYWRTIFSKCTNHVFTEENIEKISEVLNKHPNSSYVKENHNLSNYIISSDAAFFIDNWYTWYYIDKYLPEPYRGSNLQDILENESF